MNNNTKKITTTAMLSAIAYVVVGRIPVVLFLKYDPKDIIITLGGLICEPLTSFIVFVIVSMIEMVTISENGILGCIMNIVSSCSFACTAAVIWSLPQYRIKSLLVYGCFLRQSSSPVSC